MIVRKLESGRLLVTKEGGVVLCFWLADKGPGDGFALLSLQPEVRHSQ